MTTKRIFEAQKVLRALDGTPIKWESEGGTRVSVTYDVDTYNALLGILIDVANTPLCEPQEYHREKI